MLPVGTMLHDRYRVERYLASGGFGNTYLAHDTLFDETVAVKEFFMRSVSQRDTQSLTVSVSNPSNRAGFDSQLRKFRTEALRLRKLKNDHIVRVHDLFDEFGTCYYVMDYIEGQSLSALLKQRRQPFDENTVRGFLDQILVALDETHRKSIWHLDIKPGNLMMNADGKLLLIDFGASKLVDSTGDHNTSSMMAYTPGYAPIEQMEQRLDAIGAHTDIYALGGTLYNLLTGNNPPERSLIDDYGDAAFQYPPSVTPAMRNLIRYMMQPLRRLRPQNIAQLRLFIAANNLGPVVPENPIIEEAPDDNDVTLVGQPAPQPAPQPLPKPEPKPLPQPKPDPKPLRKPEPKLVAKPVPEQRQGVAQQPQPKEQNKKKLYFGIAAALAAILLVAAIVLFSGRNSSPEMAPTPADSIAVAAADTAAADTAAPVTPVPAVEPKPATAKDEQQSTKKSSTTTAKSKSQSEKPTTKSTTQNATDRSADAAKAAQKAAKDRGNPSSTTTTTDRTRHAPSSLGGNSNSGSSNESNTRTRHVPNL